MIFSPEIYSGNIYSQNVFRGIVGSDGEIKGLYLLVQTVSGVSLPIKTINFGADIDVYGHNLSGDPRQYQISEGGAWETDESDLYPGAQPILIPKIYDVSGNNNNATQTEQANQPEEICLPKTVGAELSSGNLSIGTNYKITAQNTVDFTLDGSPDNNVGTVFRATGNSQTLTANDKVKPVLTWFPPEMSFLNSYMDTYTISGETKYSFFIYCKSNSATAQIFIDNRASSDAPGFLLQYFDGFLRAKIHDQFYTTTLAATNDYHWFYMIITENSVEIGYDDTSESFTRIDLGDINGTLPIRLGTRATSPLYPVVGNIRAFGFRNGIWNMDSIRSEIESIWQ